MPGTRRKPAKQVKAKKGKQRSGDPRKRALGPAAPADQPQQPKPSPFGLPGALPPGFEMPDLGDFGKNR